MVPKTFYKDYPFKTRNKGVILGFLIKKGNALNKKFLDSQFVNFLFQCVVREIMSLTDDSTII